MSHWFKVQGFIYDPERGPNQDDSGSLVFEPDDLNLEPSRINKRKGTGRRTKASARNSLVVPKKAGVSCKKARATKKAQELTEKITSKKPNRSKVVKNVCFYASDISFNFSLLVQGHHHHEELKSMNPYASPTVVAPKATKPFIRIVVALYIRSIFLQLHPFMP